MCVCVCLLFGRGGANVKYAHPVLGVHPMRAHLCIGTCICTAQDLEGWLRPHKVGLCLCTGKGSWKRAVDKEVLNGGCVVGEGVWKEGQGGRQDEIWKMRSSIKRSLDAL